MEGDLDGSKVLESIVVEPLHCATRDMDVGRGRGRFFGSCRGREAPNERPFTTHDLDRGHVSISTGKGSVFGPSDRFGEDAPVAIANGSDAESP
jgi:hypothetical protein